MLKPASFQPVKRVDVDSNRRLGAPSSQIGKSMKAEASRMLSHVEISEMVHVIALNLLNE